MSAYTNTLESGIYEIRNRATGEVVFRHPIEDKSLLPKPIYSLHPDTRPLGKWEVVKKGGNKFVLKAHGAPTGIRNVDDQRHVYAFLTDEDKHTVEWEITKVVDTRHEEGYIIETKDFGEQIGWSAYGNDGQFGVKIAAKPLPSTRSLPPQFFVTDVFEFIRIDRE
ncbi:hypothetical protein EUX98_g2133 [Antrodiella citrinella]|uniref:Ricin B lectin domain-containing protein n=1 Tax=Antrodiella citrinella TaxID=2447956 RepID=A0A4S4N199_9APHY|nr:hypothetical protein EUX98_g2133 [Antrodiella citrinella]